MSDIAPWESGNARGQPEGAARPGSGITKPKKPYKLPTDRELPEIYQPQGGGFIAPGGRTVTEPPPATRPIEGRARTALIVLGAMVGVGLLWTVLSLVLVDAQAGPLRYVYMGIGLVLAAVGGIVLLLELPRIQAYRTQSFIPGVLVMGNKNAIEKVGGPVAAGMISMQRARASGGGVLSKVFDRSVHHSTPPEYVALHTDIGRGPELVGVQWEAVHEFQRGDIVWFRMLKPGQFLMFHKLVPYAPWTIADKATRERVFTVLRVGEPLFDASAVKQAMGKTKVFATDASGNMQVAGSAAPAAPGADTEFVPRAPMKLSAPGASLGGDDQAFQGAPGEAQFQDELDAGADQRYRLSDPGKGLGGHDYDPGDDDQQ